MKKERQKEFERAFHTFDYSDKADRLTRTVEEYRQFTNKQKLKYATIGKRTLHKLIMGYYTEK